MALDLVILSASGEPTSTVPFSVEQHQRLMNVLPAAGAFLLRRISEYYEDATYAPEEVALLVDELDRVRALVREDAELTDLIEAAVRLATEALHLGSGLVAIAD